MSWIDAELDDWETLFTHGIILASNTNSSLWITLRSLSIAFALDTRAINGPGVSFGTLLTGCSNILGWTLTALYSISTVDATVSWGGHSDGWEVACFDAHFLQFSHRFQELVSGYRWTTSVSPCRLNVNKKLRWYKSQYPKVFILIVFSLLLEF